MTSLAEPGLQDAAALAQLKAETFSETFAEDNDPRELARHLAERFAVEVVAASVPPGPTAAGWPGSTKPPSGAAVPPRPSPNGTE